MDSGFLFDILVEYDDWDKLNFLNKLMGYLCVD